MLTIILTTFNRPQYLNRLLSYYYNYKVTYPIFIADASRESHLELNKETIASVNNVLKARHLVYDSSTHQNEALFRCLELVETKYVVWLADDDFIVPTTLDFVVDFMEGNPSYEAVQGRQIQFTTSSDGPYSTSLKTAPLSMVDFSVEGASAVDRIRKRMSQKTRLSAPKSCYSVMRISNARRLWKELLTLGLTDSNTEALLGEMILLSGNIKLIKNKLYIARQYHSSNLAYQAHVKYVPIINQSSTGEQYEALDDGRLNEKISQPPDFFDQFIDPLFPTQYERMVACLTKELVKNDGVSIEKAQKIIKFWNWHFLAKKMISKFYEHGGDYYLPMTRAKVMSFSKRLWQWIRYIPSLKKMSWNISGGKMSLGALLLPNSPFHADFMPIYHAVTSSPIQNDKELSKLRL